MFPSFEHDPIYSDSTRKLTEYISKQVIREYARKLAPFSIWENQVKVIKFKPYNALTSPYTGGFCDFRKDAITVYWPVKSPTGFHLAGWTGIPSHEFAHHFIQEYYGDNIEATYLGVNLVHYSANTNTFMYAKRYWSPTMMLRAGIAPLTITMVDVKALIENKDWIMARIKSGQAPVGLPYS